MWILKKAIESIDLNSNRELYLLPGGGVAEWITKEEWERRMREKGVDTTPQNASGTHEVDL